MDEFGIQPVDGRSDRAVFAEWIAAGPHQDQQGRGLEPIQHGHQRLQAQIQQHDLSGVGPEPALQQVGIVVGWQHKTWRHGRFGWVRVVFLQELLTKLERRSPTAPAVRGRGSTSEGADHPPGPRSPPPSGEQNSCLPRRPPARPRPPPPPTACVRTPGPADAAQAASSVISSVDAPA